jgi:hypothetical protein
LKVSLNGDAVCDEGMEDSVPGMRDCKSAEFLWGFTFNDKVARWKLGKKPNACFPAREVECEWTPGSFLEELVSKGSDLRVSLGPRVNVFMVGTSEAVLGELIWLVTRE